MHGGWGKCLLSTSEALGSAPPLHGEGVMELSYKASSPEVEEGGLEVLGHNRAK